MQQLATAEVTNMPPNTNFAPVPMEVGRMYGTPVNEQLTSMKAQISREITMINDTLEEASHYLADGDCDQAARLATQASRLTEELARLSRLVAFLS